MGYVNNLATQPFTIMPLSNLKTIELLSSCAKNLQGTTSVAGDKSISHRALMISSQFLGKTTIYGLLEGEDVLNTASALERLGVKIERDADTWTVQGVGIGGLSESPDVLDMGNSGTSTRLLMGLLTPYPFTTYFTGDASLRSRPMGRVSVPLEQMGAKFISRSGGRLPIALTGTGNAIPITYRLPVASAQVKSAILLAGLNTPGKTTVIEPETTRDHTERMLKFFGYEVQTEKLADGALSISLQGRQEVPPSDKIITVPADPSSAAFVIVAALLVPGSDVTITNVCINPLRTGLFTTLIEMGASIEYTNQRSVAGEDIADLRVRHSKLKSVSVPAERAPSMIDEYPILAVAAACANGESVMFGLSELKVKESDRLAAIIDGLTQCGVIARADGDTLYVKGIGTAPPGGGLIKTKLDHRIAMSFLVMGMVTEKPVRIDDGASINTSFPGFVKLMNGLGASIGTARPDKDGSHYPPLVIAIDGPAASGKGTLARRIAEYLGSNYLDTGSLYRAVGMKLIYAEKDPENLADAIEAAKSIDIEDLSNPRLRQERIGKAASIVSAYPEVRKILLDYQRNFAHQPQGAVLDGRDIGTVVCPDADLKFFITASMDTRVDRRHRELQGQGIEVVYESVMEDLKERDARDSARKAAPLIPARDAIMIDTSTLDAKTVFKKVLSIIEARFAEKLSK